MLGYIAAVVTCLGRILPHLLRPRRSLMLMVEADSVYENAILGSLLHGATSRC